MPQGTFLVHRSQIRALVACRAPALAKAAPLGVNRPTVVPLTGSCSTVLHEPTEKIDMKNSSLFAVVFAALFATAGLASAQTPGETKPAGTQESKPVPKNEAKAGKPKVYHAGGKHDQTGHEAAEKAKAQGKTMKEPTTHAGGKHDVQGHKAAIKADQAAAKPAAEAAKK